ncbi:uncharacterized protein PFL1_05386 [Pseudozyma flocculosa PF-1]|uniref:RING-type domain-containing protein n=2 Tax=Pseudozyma flocculosa TaxID=84751 RepID=A0A5C3FAR6_9BASI|nr:uncharacterized protein PFL1_05386 [Pseudozyma flocculosa PF-1]EPQ27102.1 hypothetical protein PFL1_05386 [Pseudozyma flocculosa PF-1]SPO41330.1 uncharacterized protein PSFLO_06812 [Pseudozyma flocculosa]
MGCAICLDGFSQDASDEQRPVALACGHLYHLDCLEQWYQTSDRARRNKHHLCCLCKTTTPRDGLVKLFPQESGDLDRYLASHKAEIDERLLQPAHPPPSDHHAHPTGDRDYADVRAAAVRKEHDEANKLLGSLLDLNQHLQHWVQAVHGVRVETVVRSGSKIRKLVADLTDGQQLATNARGDLDASLSSLEAAVKSLDAQRTAFSEAERLLSQQKARYRVKSNDLRGRAEDHAKKLADAEKRFAELRAERKAVEDIIAKAVKTTEEQQKREASLAERTEALEVQQRELEAQRRQLRLETAQKARAMEQTLQDRTLEAQDKVAKSAERENEAVRERDAVLQKNNQLADQLRVLQSEVKKARMKLDKKTDEAKETTRLRKKLAETQQQLRLERKRNAACVAAATGTAALPSSTSLSGKSLVSGVGEMALPDGVRFGHPTDARAWTQGGSDACLPDSSPSSKAAVAKAERAGSNGLSLPSSTLLVESEDLDDELLQDSLYPMPGLATSPGPRTGLARSVSARSAGVGAHRDFGTKARPATSPFRATVKPRQPLLSMRPHQGTIHFHRSSSDGAVKSSSPPQPTLSKAAISARYEGKDEINRSVIDLCDSSSAAEDSKENAKAERKRADMPSLNSWLEKRNGIVLGPKRRRK